MDQPFIDRRFYGFYPACTFVLSVLVLTFASAQIQAATCTRSCLQHMIAVYVDALVAHDPSQLPLASDVRFTEDSHELEPGEGLWKSVTAKGHFRQDYVDTRKQIVAAHVELFEGDSPVLLAVVLRVTNRKIAGIETIVYRVPADSKSKPDHLDQPLPVMNEPVPPAKRMARAEMVKTALRYTEGLTTVADYMAVYIDI